MYWKLKHVKPKPHTKTGEFLLPNHHQYPENGIAPPLTRPKAAPWWLVDMTLVSRWRCDQKTLSHLSQQEANPLKPMANCLDIMQPYATNANHFRWLVLLLIYCTLCANSHPHLHLHLHPGLTAASGNRSGASMSAAPTFFRFTQTWRGWWFLRDWLRNVVFVFFTSPNYWGYFMHNTYPLVN